MYPYSADYWYPPAPVVDIVVSKPGNHSVVSREVIALVDSGADITCIPESIIHDLGLMLVDFETIEGFDENEASGYFVYSAEMSIPGSPSQIVRVIPYHRDEYGLLGRDVINNWHIELDGPALQLRLL